VVVHCLVSSYRPSEVAALPPHFTDEKLRLREMKTLAQDHAASLRGSLVHMPTQMSRLSSSCRNKPVRKRRLVDSFLLGVNSEP
jgi:hypothetical protein